MWQRSAVDRYQINPTGEKGASQVHNAGIMLRLGANHLRSSRGLVASERADATNT
jgi:hypothetical protein